jgi:site-specific DNA-methyltransferase (adenine-specific)
VDITAEEFKDWTKNVWYIPNYSSKKEHPAPFPPELPERLIKLYTYRGNVVLDMFNGTGSTTTAAHTLGRQFIGIDQSARYCAMARRALVRPS